MRRLVERDATKNGPGPKKEFFPSATAMGNGIPEISGPSCGACTTPNRSWRKPSRVSAFQLDRTRYLAIHPRREYPDCAALFREGTAYAGARRIADFGGAALHSAITRGRTATSELPDAFAGCTPCTGAICSEADTVPKIIEELFGMRKSERQNRIIDYDQKGPWN